MATIATPADFSAALRARDRGIINQVAARMLKQRTRLGSEWFSVANVMLHNGEIGLAVSAGERGVEECGGSVKARFQLAHLLSDAGRQEEAIALLASMASGEINPVQRDHLFGTCALEMADFDTARDAFNRVVTAAPAVGPSWLSLAALPPTDDAALLDRLSNAGAAVAKAPGDYLAQWHYAKGTVLDRIGRTDEAFASFTAGADLVRIERNYDRDGDGEVAESLIADFTQQSIVRLGEQMSVDTSAPILVIGLPRSGTTLVEQILTSHSMVAGGDELPFGAILAREIGGNALAPLESFVRKHGSDQLARLYLHLGEEYFGKGRRFVDKNLGNSRDLGVLASILPKAPVIWLRRDPLDCAWSCFRTYFSAGLEWSFSLADIGAHFWIEDRLFAHWRQMLGERLLEVSYERLVNDPPTETDRILRHVGLEREAGMEEAHAARRSVTTASLAQVRQPVYRSAVGAANLYRDHLQPFIDAYSADSRIEGRSGSFA
jgi:tetratricopeptide (TPR) repeat protein